MDLDHSGFVPIPNNVPADFDHRNLLAKSGTLPVHNPSSGRLHSAISQPLGFRQGTWRCASLANTQTVLSLTRDVSYSR